MKTIRGKGLLSILMLVAVVITVPDSAQALGTASNTTINNLATINYNVGGVGQTLIESSTAGNTIAGLGNGTATAFVVDNKIDLTVSTIDVAAVQVSPGSTGGTGVNVMTFRVDNTGNTVQDYSLAVQAVANGIGNGKFLGNVTFQAPGPTIRVNSVKMDAAATYDSTVDTAIYIDELAANEWVYVFVTANIPAGQVNGDTASYHLRAQTAVGGGAAAQGADITTDDNAAVDDPAVVQTVFADGQGSDTANDAATDGIHSSQDDYIVASAILTVTKTATTHWDPFNGNTNPKAIPGAYMQYTITVANSALATANAQLTTITDTLAAAVLAMDPDLILDNGAVPIPGLPESVAGSGFKVTYTAGNRTFPASPSYYTTLGADGILHDGSATGGVITATMTDLLKDDIAFGSGLVADGELEPGDSVSIIFNVIIQ